MFVNCQSELSINQKFHAPRRSFDGAVMRLAVCDVLTMGFINDAATGAKSWRTAKVVDIHKNSNIVLLA